MAKTIHELLKYGIEVNTLSPPLMEFLRYFGTFPDIDDCLCFHCCTVGGAITHFIKEYWIPEPKHSEAAAETDAHAK